MHTKIKTAFDVPTILNVKLVVDEVVVDEVVDVDVVVDDVVDDEVENVFMSKIVHYLYCI